ncbi:PREDICTED: uncharacterized protein LOC108978209 [Bactrocera latifrons]|uniref:uncharacterized protein LOC108978209 n=1 Tax=Bactrocera latifrons TaxID=174628 RepID=UPI0008DC7317|nr:PREDICTED: uncharacterized protein LOC108978209 [Bactrocera latifrons]
MFKSKSFRINHEIDKKPKVHDHCYESKRIRWMKFLIIPLIIAFSLLLVLSNVNFSGESYEHTVTPSGGSHTRETETPTKEVVTVSNINQGIAMEEAALDNIKLYDEEEKRSGAVDVAVQYMSGVQRQPHKGFQCTDNNTCSFKMSTLTIRYCTLDTIVDNAFNYQTLNKLTSLTFVDVQLKSLNAQTFLGLETVENFQLFNVLKQVTLPLNANVYKRQDLSGTKFNDTLNGNTFAKLLAVQELRLANCSLSRIAENVFTGIMSTLKSLDLRYNRLQTLDGKFLCAAISKGIIMELGWNMWRCDCDNMETIEYMKQIENNSAANTVCATPTDLAGTQVSSSQISCYITTVPTTILTTTAATTTTTTTPTTTITVETTLATKETSADTIPTSSTIAIDSTSLMASDSTTNIAPTTVDDKTEEIAESSPETLPTTYTTIIDNSTLMTSATTEGTDVSESTDKTLVSTIVTTISPTKPKYTTISTSAGTTSETVTPPSSPMTSTTEDNSSKETSKPISTTTTPQLTDTTNDNTTLTFFTGTITIPIATDDTTEGTTKGTVNPENTTEIVINTTLTWSTFVPTTIIPSTNSCFGNKAPKYLPCSDIVAFKLCDYDVTFNVAPISSRSVQLQIGGGANDLHIIYFRVTDNSISEDVEIENNIEIVINNLVPNGSYTFCLIPKNKMSTSPFNCRSAHLPQLEAWLEYNAVALFCTIAILVTVVCAVMGVTGVYFLLRWRPTFLYGNKRLHRIASTTHEVLLLPKPIRTSVDSKTYALSELSKMHSSVSDSLTPENYLNINSYDYMQYVKDIELKKQRRVAHISTNQPPIHRAPALPPNVVGAATNSYTSGYIPIRHPSQLSAVVMKDAQQQQRGVRRGAPTNLPPEPVDVVENEYESLDYYQEIY